MNVFLVYVWKKHEESKVQTATHKTMFVCVTAPYCFIVCRIAGVIVSSTLIADIVVFYYLFFRCVFVDSECECKLAATHRACHC